MFVIIIIVVIILIIWFRSMTKTAVSAIQERTHIYYKYWKNQKETKQESVFFYIENREVFIISDSIEIRFELTNKTTLPNSVTKYFCYNYLLQKQVIIERNDREESIIVYYLYKRDQPFLICYN